MISGSRGIDHILIISIAALASIGFVMIASATLDFASLKYSTPFYFVIRHSIYLILGISIAYIISKIKLQFYNDYSKLFLITSFVLCLIVFIPGVGLTTHGATRWLNLKIITIQVAEISRLFLLIWVASYIVRNNINQSFNKCLILVALLSAIILFQRDFGSTVLLIAAFFSLSLIAGVDAKKFFLYIFGAILVLLPMIIFQPYRMKRIATFINPWEDPLGGGFQLIASQLAFSKGGIFGLGLGSSVQKLSYLPESHNDFIFAIIGEELGLLFCVLIIFIFVLIITRIFILANQSIKNNLYFASYLAYIIGFLITYQTLIHILVNIGLAPTKGMGLPFISYGGTNLLVMFICLGILIRIQIENRQKISQAVQRGY